MKPMDKNSMGEGYEKTKPWHPLYNIIFFSLFGWLYMNGLAEPTITEALITRAIWTSICIVFDLFGWVLIKHPWSLSFKGFYVDYQPWITLIYLGIFRPYYWLFVYFDIRKNKCFRKGVIYPSRTKILKSLGSNQFISTSKTKPLNK